MEKTDEELKVEINEFLENLGVRPELKGFSYMADLILLAKRKKKFSVATFTELEHEVAEKYRIKDFSVQRQLRYAVTLQNDLRSDLTPVDLMYRAFREIKLEKE